MSSPKRFIPKTRLIAETKPPPFILTDPPPHPYKTFSSLILTLLTPEAPSSLSVLCFLSRLVVLFAKKQLQNILGPFDVKRVECCVLGLKVVLAQLDRSLVKVTYFISEHDHSFIFILIRPRFTQKPKKSPFQTH